MKLFCRHHDTIGGRSYTSSTWINITRTRGEQGRFGTPKA